MENNFKVIHWDLSVPATCDLQVRKVQEFHYSLLRSTKDNKILGFSVTWKFRLHTPEGAQLLSYIAETKYFLARLPDIQAVRWCVYNSHRDYMIEYYQRAIPLGVICSIPLLRPGEIDFQEILNRLANG